MKKFEKKFSDMADERRGLEKERKEAEKELQNATAEWPSPPTLLQRGKHAIPVNLGGLCKQGKEKATTLENGFLGVSHRETGH